MLEPSPPSFPPPSSSLPSLSSASPPRPANISAASEMPRLPRRFPWASVAGTSVAALRGQPKTTMSPAGTGMPDGMARVAVARTSPSWAKGAFGSFGISSSLFLPAEAGRASPSSALVASASPATAQLAFLSPSSPPSSLSPSRAADASRSASSSDPGSASPSRSMTNRLSPLLFLLLSPSPSPEASSSEGEAVRSTTTSPSSFPSSSPSAAGVTVRSTTSGSSSAPASALAGLTRSTRSGGEAPPSLKRSSSSSSSSSSPFAFRSCCAALLSASIVRLKAVWLSLGSSSSGLSLPPLLPSPSSMTSPIRPSSPPNSWLTKRVCIPLLDGGTTPHTARSTSDRKVHTDGAAKEPNGMALIAGGPSLLPLASPKRSERSSWKGRLGSHDRRLLPPAWPAPPTPLPPPALDANISRQNRLTSSTA
mmetsp:Transcript_516/g.1572  ORF Transcript_516/g.1572 Transcript_516/m.1572 type:complete len:423 (-) Transcript_516:625-1893(-)